MRIFALVVCSQYNHFREDNSANRLTLHIIFYIDKMENITPNFGKSNCFSREQLRKNFNVYFHRIMRSSYGICKLCLYILWIMSTLYIIHQHWMCIQPLFELIFFFMTAMKISHKTLQLILFYNLPGPQKKVQFNELQFLDLISTSEDISGYHSRTACLYIHCYSILVSMFHCSMLFHDKLWLHVPCSMYHQSRF